MADDPQVKFCLRCGQALERCIRFGALRPVCPSCSYTHFFDPKVAAAIWAERSGKVLMVRRAIDPARGKWTVPGGFVNSGEDPALAAARECKDETGLNVEITGLLDIVAGREHARGADFVVFYQASPMGGSPRACDEVDRVEWFGPRDLPTIAFKATQTMIEAWLTDKLKKTRTNHY